MNEYTIGYIACGSLLGLVVASLLYMLGGRNNKGIRRFGASFIIAATVNLAVYFLGNFSWWMLSLYPLLILQFIQGYSDDEGKGWVKRLGITATSVITGAILCFILGGGWWLLVIHLWVSLITTQFSFKNPIMAAAEEPMVCFLNNIAIIFYPFIS